MKQILRLLCAIVLTATVHAQARDPLASWNDGPTKRRIVAFVTAVIEQGGKDFVPPPERIAVFDNDGTLWVEQPIYAQFGFAFDRVKALAPSHPEWKIEAPFNDVLEGNLKAVAASGEAALVKLLIATNTGTTTAEFTQEVSDWMARAKHPRFKRPYTDLAYQPMIELLTYLRENGFRTYIVSGGTVEFMRPWTDRVYGIPAEQVIGTTFVTRYDKQPDGVPVLLREPKIDFMDNGPGKPVAIQQTIGRRPILAFGNSDGDEEMLEWVAAGDTLHFEALVHHTDAVREYAYDRMSDVGRLDHALDEAKANKWAIVDMKRDWKQIFAFEGTAR
jgi:phosphoglycolate phosphatase-like HAD superfamily hydrolase